VSYFTPQKKCNQGNHKSSAVAEMGDRAGVVGRKVWAATRPFVEGSWSPSSMSHRPRAYFCAKCHADSFSHVWPQQTWAKNGMGLLCQFPWGRGLRSHLTQYPLGRGLPPYQVVSWSMQAFGHNRDGSRIIRLRP